MKIFYEKKFCVLETLPSVTNIFLKYITESGSLAPQTYIQKIESASTEPES